MTVTDPRHPLVGQRLTVLSLLCARGPRFIAVALPDGRRRLIRRAATDLERPACATELPVPRVSARTLLPLARLVRSVLAASSAEPADAVPSPPDPASTPAPSTAPKGHGRRSRPRRSGNWPKAWPACCGAYGRRRAVLSAPEWAPECVGAAHRAKLAYVYVRQSTAMQVRQHQESTELQYRLVDRAAGLGWPRERIAVIDDDLDHTKRQL